MTWIPSYGPEMRGGTANCSVIVSDKKISSPIILEASTVVAMNQPSLAKFEPMIRQNGQLFINISLKPESIIEAMEKLMKGSKEYLLPLNKKALTAWKNL